MKKLNITSLITFRFDLLNSKKRIAPYQFWQNKLPINVFNRIASIEATDISIKKAFEYEENNY